MTAQLPSKQRLETLIRAIECESYDEEEIVSWVNSDEILSMARALLAAHEQEPVAWTSQRSLDVRDKITAFTSEESAIDYGKSVAWGDIAPLYTHPAPVPAVPGEINIYTTDRYVMQYAKGWNACRAAMLNGADVSLTHEGKNHSEDNLDMVDHSGSDTEMVNLPVTGWLRADYCDDNRRGDAPLFVLGNKDPSSAWDVKYIPLSAMLNGGKS